LLDIGPVYGEASAASYGARVDSSRKTKRTSSTPGWTASASLVAPIATGAASSIGKP
jgi:hypothetical protein